VSDDAPPLRPASDWSPGWIRRRARNVYRRPLLVGGVAAACFTVIVVALVTTTHGAPRAAQAAGGDRSIERPDTLELRDTLRILEARSGAADSALVSGLAAARSLATPDPEVNVGPAPGVIAAKRDSLTAAIARLDTLIQRAQDAPLPASYAALGDELLTYRDEQVRSLLDTLASIEATRAGFGAAGGVDPIFVALTSRATLVGRQIQELGRKRQLALHRAIAELGESSARAAPPPRRPRVEPPDTLTLARAAFDARREANAARRALSSARLLNQEIDERLARQRVAAASSSGIPAIWPAALIVGLVAGLGVAFGLEARDPRVADAAEAEATAESESLVTLGPNERTQERRRRADRQVPPLVELASDGFRLLHTQLADRSFQLPLVAVLGDSPVVTAVVAANLAAAVARQVRTTLLVDADFETHSLATITRVRREPGLANVISGEAEWATAVSSVVVDRDRTMDVLPGGSFGLMPSGRGRRLDAADAGLAEILERVSRRYECVVVSMPISRHGTIPIPTSARMPAVVCVRTGRTRVNGLSEVMAALREHGALVRGLVIWDRDDPMAAG
jgi:Mrp family chromosome partitioning ATPase